MARHTARRTVKEFGPDPIDAYVGARLRQRRIGLRLSQTELGRAVGITFQQIQKYERGTNRIGASNLFKFAQHLGVSVEYFFDNMPRSIAGAPDGTAATGLSEDPVQSKEAVHLLYNYFRIPDERTRMRISQLVKTLARTANKDVN